MIFSRHTPDPLAKRAREHHERLGPLAKEAGESTDARFVAKVCAEIKQSIAELLPDHTHDHIAGQLADEIRCYIMLSSRLPEPPWADVATLGVLYSSVYSNVLEQGRSQGRDVTQLMEAGRSVSSIATYAHHRTGRPGFAGKMMEDLAGSVFDADRLLTVARSHTPNRAAQQRIADEQHIYLERFAREDIPVTDGMSEAETAQVHRQYFETQIARALALPRHLRLLAASMLNCAPQVAAVECGRDVVYLALSFRGTTAIRYRCDLDRAGETASVELDRVTSRHTVAWIDTLRRAYRLYGDRTINGEHLDTVISGLLQEIGTAVMAPLFQAWPDLDNFGLIPIGSAASLPLHGALVDGRPACMHRGFTIAPSALTLYAAAQFTAQPVGTALVAVDPSEGRGYLRNTVIEAARVASLYGTTVVGPARTPPPIQDPEPVARMLDDENQKRTIQSNALWNEIGDSITRPVAHFACHGALADFPSPNAYLMLGDGGISLTDFLGGGRLLSPGGVVVLSACSVGSVVASAPAELIGFPAVLLGAGVRTVIAPTWPVLDSHETIELMVTLHQSLLAGRPAAAALAASVRHSFESGASSAVWGVLAAFGH